MTTRRQGRPRGLRVRTCTCGRRVAAKRGQKTATCMCGKTVKLTSKRSPPRKVFNGYLDKK